MLDLNANPCQSDVITVAVSSKGGTGAVVSTDGSAQVITSKWGGPRANSGGPRANSGGARPGAGRKPKPPIQASYAPAVPVWCVIAFWGQAEVSGTRELTREGYETCLPLRAIRRQDAVLTSIWHTVRVPLFSGYGFIRLTQHESREPILAIRGVREVLRRPDGRAASVPDALVEKLIEDAPRRLELPKEHAPILDPGTIVRIKDGTFGGFAGSVVECDGVNTKVDIEMFGRLVPVWIDRVGVEVL